MSHRPASHNNKDTKLARLSKNKFPRLWDGWNIFVSLWEAACASVSFSWFGHTYVSESRAKAGALRSQPPFIMQQRIAKKGAFNFFMLHNRTRLRKLSPAITLRANHWCALWILPCFSWQAPVQSDVQCNGKSSTDRQIYCVFEVTAGEGSSGVSGDRFSWRIGQIHLKVYLDTMAITIQHFRKRSFPCLISHLTNCFILSALKAKLAAERWELI